jgi:hypothetical protein
VPREQIAGRVADLIALMDLGEAAGTIVADYSAGMTKKVALACALVHAPRLLVLDEPFESVDPVSAANIEDVLRSYTSSGGTIIISSHSMDLVQRMCDHVAVIAAGRVLAAGTVDEVRAGESLQDRFLSLVGGFLLYLNSGVQDWLTPSVGPSIEKGIHTISPDVLTVLTVVVALLGAAGGFVAFRTVPAVQPVGSPITVATRRNLYADAFNEKVLMRPGQWLSRALVFLDNRGVDGAVNGLGATVGGGSSRLRRLQSGFVRSYALSMLAGTVAVVAVLLAVRFA